MRAVLRWWVVCSFALIVLLAGCGKETPEDAVIAQYQRGEDAIASRDVTTFKNTMTTESWDFYDQILKNARELKEADAKKLPPTQMMLVVALRNRVPAGRLKQMTAEDFVIWQIENGELIVDADLGIYPFKVVNMREDSAQLQMGQEKEQSSGGFRVRRRRGAAAAVGATLSIAAAAKKDLEPIPGLVYEFKNLGGYWYHDTLASYPMNDQFLIKAANFEGLEMPDYCVAIESEVHGSCSETVWQPPK
jgi:hypothetical protein